jgi:hypothetical protein
MMGEFCLLYLLCMLRFPVPLHSLLTNSHIVIASGCRQALQQRTYRQRRRSCGEPMRKIDCRDPAFNDNETECILLHMQYKWDP